MERTKTHIPFLCPWQLCMECWKLWKDNANVVKFKDLEWKNSQGTLHSTERQSPSRNLGCGLWRAERLPQKRGKATHASHLWPQNQSMQTWMPFRVRTESLIKGHHPNRLLSQTEADTSSWGWGSVPWHLQSWGLPNSSPLAVTSTKHKIKTKPACRKVTSQIPFKFIASRLKH